MAQSRLGFERVTGTELTSHFLGIRISVGVINHNNLSWRWVQKGNSGEAPPQVGRAPSGTNYNGDLQIFLPNSGLLFLKLKRTEALRNRQLVIYVVGKRLPSRAVPLSHLGFDASFRGGKNRWMPTIQNFQSLLRRTILVVREFAQQGVGVYAQDL